MIPQDTEKVNNYFHFNEESFFDNLRFLLDKILRCVVIVISVNSNCFVSHWLSMT
jgi:hypothetical protein